MTMKEHDLTDIFNKLMRYGLADFDNKTYKLSGTYIPSQHKYFLSETENKLFLEVLHEASNKEELQYCTDDVPHEWSFELLLKQ